jgi:hypothetical protein
MQINKMMTEMGRILFRKRINSYFVVYSDKQNDDRNGKNLFRKRINRYFVKERHNRYDVVFIQINE